MRGKVEKLYLKYLDAHKMRAEVQKSELASLNNRPITKCPVSIGQGLFDC